MHVIRLRGPWEYSTLEQFCGNTPSLPAGKVTMPCDWGHCLGADFRGRVRYVRHFGKPTTEPHESVRLVIGDVRGRATVTLNGQPMAGQGGGDVTQRLEFRNVLEIVVEQPADAPEPGGIIGEVRLEIETNDKIIV